MCSSLSSSLLRCLISQVLFLLGTHFVQSGYFSFVSADNLALLQFNLVSLLSLVSFASSHFFVILFQTQLEFQLFFWHSLALLFILSLATLSTSLSSSFSSCGAFQATCYFGIKTNYDDFTFFSSSSLKIYILVMIRTSNYRDIAPRNLKSRSFCCIAAVKFGGAMIWYDCILK